MKTYHYFAEDGSYGRDIPLALDTTNWTEDDWSIIENCADYERVQLATAIDQLVTGNLKGATATVRFPEGDTAEWYLSFGDAIANPHGEIYEDSFGVDDNDISYYLSRDEAVDLLVSVKNKRTAHSVDDDWVTLINTVELVK